MTPAGSASQSTDDYEYIDLDDTRRWWMAPLVTVAVGLMIAVFLAPWFVQIGDDEDPSVASSTLRSTNSICQPDTSELPNFLDPSIGSWTRFCEWFIEPNLESTTAP